MVLEEPGLRLDSLGPLESYIRQMRELAASGRSAADLLPGVAAMTIPVPGIDQTVRLGDVRPQDYLRLLAECLSLLDTEVLDFILALRLTEGWDLDRLLQQVACPALLLQGDPALGGLQDDVAQQAADLLPDGRRLKIEGAGHNIHQAQPQAILRAVEEFLAAA